MNPQLVLVSQEALSVEKFAQNGVTKEVHSVTKGMPFVVELTTMGSWDLNSATIQGRLLYDYCSEDEPEKLVDAPREEPLEYKAHVADDGNTAKAECRVKVLTSQHANSLFRVRFTATSAESGLALQVTSHPLRVVSKPKQALKSTLETTKKRPRDYLAQNTQPVPDTKVVKRGKTTVSSAAENTISETLERLEKQQAAILKMVSEGKRSSFSNNPEVDFREALVGLLECFERLPKEDRLVKVQKALMDLSPAQTDSLSQLSLLTVQPTAHQEVYSDEYSSDLLEQDIYSPEHLLSANFIA